MGYQRKRKVYTKQTSTFGLNINSMTDMFTIMLCFLLQTYSTSQIEINPADGVRLPSSATYINPTEGIRVSLSPTQLKIDEIVVAELKNGEFVNSAVDGKDSNFLPKLFEELVKTQKQNELLADKKKEHIEKGKILLQADQSLSYATLRKVMYTASMAGYPQLKLATVVGE